MPRTQHVPTESAQITCNFFISSMEQEYLIYPVILSMRNGCIGYGILPTQESFPRTGSCLFRPYVFYQLKYKGHLN